MENNKTLGFIYDLLVFLLLQKYITCAIYSVEHRQNAATNVIETHNRKNVTADLNNTRIEHVHKNVCIFDELLNTINCDNLALKTFPDLPTSVNGISVRNNPITYIPPLKKYSKLTYLDISNTSITSLDKEVFTGLINLQVLHIRQCSMLQHITSDIFTSLTNLKTLAFSDSFRLLLDKGFEAIDSLPNGTLEHAFLDNMNFLVNSGIYQIRNEKLQVLKRHNIKTLSLYWNHIISLEPGFSDFIPNVEHLNIGFNFFVYIDPNQRLTLLLNFLSLQKMRLFDASFNVHGHIGPGRIDVHLDGNQCMPVPIGLELVFFSHSTWYRHFIDINNFLFCRNNIRELHLSDTNVGSVRGHFVNLTHLEYFNFQNGDTTMVTHDVFDCKHWPNIRTLLMGGNNLYQVFNQTDNTYNHFKSCHHLNVIDLADSHIDKLSKDSFIDAAYLREVNVSQNNLVIFDVNLSNNYRLELLNVSNNMISRLSEDFTEILDRINSGLKKNSTARSNKRLIVDMLNNPLICSCETVDFIEWCQTTNVTLNDLEKYTCIYHGKRMLLLDIDVHDLRIKCHMPLIIAITVTSLTTILILIVTLVIYKKRWRLQYYALLAKQSVRKALRSKQNHNQTYKYDAFVSYSANDDEWVLRNLHSVMEGEHGLKLCLHQRDFTPGNDIQDNIVVSIEESHKAVLVISNNFLQSKWCYFELQMARNKLLDSTTDIVVLILLDEPARLARELVTPTLRSLLATKTYLKAPRFPEEEDLFWLKLKETIMKDIQRTI
ncbi:unnamed protein product [Owenia fusiformis]|uniref:Uncharacterized protein n=1 Tax=Owenia fusiformis TaxID=6347 RepID=A0A8J1XXP8_OWEFU|nr:unnamed protein product [Owenia fusiformis]